MKELFLGIIVILMIGFGFRYLNLKSNTFFGPQERALENKIYKESEQFNDGMIRDLENLRMEYLKSTEIQKEALKATILHRFSSYDLEKLNYELKQFYLELRGN